MTKNKKKLRCKLNKDDTKNKNSEDVELCLEVEMDDDVKDIITSADKCSSTLLDVTVIKQKNFDKAGTTQKRTLSNNEVRKFIASMNIDNYDDDKDVEQSGGDAGKKQTHHFESFLEQMKKILLHKEVNNDVKQVYTTPRTYHDLDSIFACKNKNRKDDDKQEELPCLCKNCAVIGILSDSQKRPFITENTWDPRDVPNCRKREEPKKKKTVNFRDDDHIECRLHFKELHTKIRELEARLMLQEEKCVPRDYFRRIISKLVAHITKITNGDNNVKVNSQHQSRRCNYRDKDHHKHQDNYADKYNYKDKYCNRFYVHPVLFEDGNIPQTSENSKTRDPNPKEEDNQNFWKWGEDFLKPGIDLKNRIIQIMEETLNHLKWSKDKTKEEEIKLFVDQFSTKLYKAVHEIPVQQDEKKQKEARLGSNPRKKRMFADNVSVSYINPQMAKWQDSLGTLLFDSDWESYKCNNKITEYYKSEFLQTILNTKDEDRRTLWQSIWAQAVNNKQTKRDKVTIQFPDKNDMKGGMDVQIEYTIGDLEQILIGRRSKSKIR